MSAHTHAPSLAIDDALAAAALGALDAGERAALDALLASCPACREELADMQRATLGIALSLEDVEPPASLRDKVMHQAQQTRTLKFEVRPAVPEPQRQLVSAGASRRSNVIPWLAVAASLVLLFASSWYAMLARRQAAEAFSQRQAADARTLTIQDQMTKLEARMNVMGAPDMQKVSLLGQPDAPDSSAQVFMSPKRGMVLTAEHLPALAAGRTYQLWVVTKQAPVSVGTFTVQADGSVTGVMPLTAEATLNPVAVAVTIEPAGGVPSPTGPKVLVGMLTPQ